jgi:hypothetical protein
MCVYLCIALFVIETVVRKHFSGCPKLLAAETKLGCRKISFAVTWVYQNKNLSEELRIYYFICPNEL